MQSNHNVGAVLWLNAERLLVAWASFSKFPDLIIFLHHLALYPVCSAFTHFFSMTTKCIKFWSENKRREFNWVSLWTLNGVFRSRWNDVHHGKQLISYVLSDARYWIQNSIEDLSIPKLDRIRTNCRKGFKCLVKLNYFYFWRLYPVASIITIFGGAVNRNRIFSFECFLPLFHTHYKARRDRKM
jgi:hypothetical protein